jgi:hypothetical protein
MRIILLILVSSMLAIPTYGQDSACAHGRAEQRFTITVPADVARDSLIARSDTVMSALGYERSQPAENSGRYLTTWRLDWPLGTERAPWRRAGLAPGVRLDLQFRGRGRDKAEISVKVEALCALQSPETSRGQASTEHLYALFSAMQVVIALTKGIDASLHAFDRD